MQLAVEQPVEIADWTDYRIMDGPGRNLLADRYICRRLVEFTAQHARSSFFTGLFRVQLSLSSLLPKDGKGIRWSFEGLAVRWLEGVSGQKREETLKPRPVVRGEYGFKGYGLDKKLRGKLFLNGRERISDEQTLLGVVRNAAMIWDVNFDRRRLWDGRIIQGDAMSMSSDIGFDSRDDDPRTRRSNIMPLSEIKVRVEKLLREGTAFTTPFSGHYGRIITWTIEAG